jgi:hypothetical protein
MMSAEIPHANNDTIFDTNCVRKRGDEMGWHTAMKRSHAIIKRNIDEENWVIDVEIIYSLHNNDPNIHSFKYIVVKRNGIPMRNDSSAIARFRM